MDTRIQRVTEGLQEMIQPYLGRQEYGNLCEYPKWETETLIRWFVNYEMILGSSSGISVNFLKEEQTFEYLRHPDNQKTRAVNPEEVLNHFGQRLEYIKPQRREHLRMNAELQKGKGVPLETAVANMKEFAEQTPKFGPTEEELILYTQFCQEVYSTK